MGTSTRIPTRSRETPIWKKAWFWIATVSATVLFLGIAVRVAETWLPAELREDLETQDGVREKIETDIVAIQKALTEFAKANGQTYPDSLQALLTPDAHGRTYLPGPDVPKDPWGRTYLYEPPGRGIPVPRIRSYGKDGRFGGTGLDADIDNLSFQAPE